MTTGTTVGNGASVAPLDEQVDHIRGPAGAPVLLVYGDYECPATRRAFREVEAVERALPEGVRVAFRHFPLTDLHPHALAAACAAEAAALQGRFWEMHQDLLDHQKALTEDDLVAYAVELGLDKGRLDLDRHGAYVARRVARDVASAKASGQVVGTPTLFVDGLLHFGSFDADRLLEGLDEAG